MPISIFLLTLYVFLQSASSPALAWIDPAVKLTAIVGIVFVVSVLVEAFFWVYRGQPLLPIKAFHRRAAE